MLIIGRQPDYKPDCYSSTCENVNHLENPIFNKTNELFYNPKCSSEPVCEPATHFAEGCREVSDGNFFSLFVTH